MDKKPRRVKHGTFLNVPREERREAKAYGGRWDPEHQRWYVPRGLDPRPFRRWYPAELLSEIDRRAVTPAHPLSVCQARSHPSESSVPITEDRAKGLPEH
jgi:hypothetical protein